MKEFDQDEKTIQEAFSQIEADPNRLAIQVKRRLHEKEIPQRKTHTGSRLRTVSIAMALCAALVITAAASELGGFDWFIEKFNPAFGDIVEPVEITAEDQGIRLEIIGAQKYGNQAIVYLSLQDLTGQNRLTEKTDFKDGFSVKMDPLDLTDGEDRVSSVSWRPTLLYLDEDSNTAYYEFNISTDGNVMSDPLTLGSSRIYFDEANYENAPIPIDLSQVATAQMTPIQSECILGGSGDLDYDNLSSVLKPGYVAPMPHGLEDQWISSLGYADGRLHVQLGLIWNSEFGSSDMNLALLDGDGEELDYDYEAMFVTDKEYHPISIEDESLPSAPYKYTEFVFTVAESELSDYTLCFTGFTCTGVQGTWKVTAHLSDISEQMVFWKDVAVTDGHLFEHAALSPLGLQVIGSYQTEGYYAHDMEISVETTEGIVMLEGGSGSQNSQTKTFQYHWTTKKPLDVKTVTAIIVNDIRIPIE